MSLRALRFAFVFLVGLPAHVPVQTLARPRPARRTLSPWQAYVQSGYDFCDAKMLAGLWRTNVTQAKKTIGRKMTYGGRRSVEAALSSARRNARRNRAHACSYHEAGYRYQDAEQLATRWDVPVHVAKRMMQDKLIAGQRKRLDRLVGRVTQRPLPTARPARPVTRMDPWRAWTKSGYDYCDAKILGLLWRQSTYQAKKTVGAKVSAGGRGAVKSALFSARKRAHRRPYKACSIQEAGFSYSDAQRLGKRWRMPTNQAKTRMVHKIIDGGAPALRRMLKRARPTARRLPVVAPHRARQTFLDQGHGYCDAKALGALWQTSPVMAKAMAGHMLLGGGRKTLGGTLHMARKRVARTRRGACTFSEAGFTNQDAHTLARVWRMRPAKARAFAEKKLMWGGEATIRAILARGAR